MKKFLIIIASVVVALVAIVCVAISPAAKYVVNNYGPDIIGRQMSVQKVGINLLSGRVRIQDFKLQEDDDTLAFVSLDELDTKANLWRLLSHTVDIRYVRLNGLNARVIQNGRDFNFDDIIEFYSSPEDSTEVDTLDTGRVWNIEINDIAFNQGYVSYQDVVLDASLGLRNLNLMIPALYFSNRNSNVDIEFNFDEGGTLRTHLAYSMEQGDFALHVNLDSLNLASLQPYVMQSFNVGSFEGSLWAVVDLIGNLNHIMDFDASGSLNMAHLAATDLEGAPLASVDTLHVGMKNLSLLRRNCALDVVYLNGARVAVEMSREGEMNLAALIKESAPDTTAVESLEPVADTTDNKPFALTIGQLSLSGIGVDYTDYSMHQPFSYSLSNITLHSRNFDLAGTNRAMMTARLGKAGRANVSWSGSLHNLNDQKLNLNVENVRMADFSPFCYEYTSYPLTGGNMTFSSDNIVSNSRLNSNNKIDVYQCTAGHKDRSYKAEYSNIPVRMGLYLLKDMDEHVKMEIPVRGTLGSPEFSFRKIIFKAIGNAMLKVVASPFVFLKGANNGIKDIPVEPTSATFTTQQYESLTTIAEAIKAKPEMSVTLRQHINTNGLQEQLEQMALMRDYHNSLTDKPTEKLSPMDTERIATLSYPSAELDEFAKRCLIEKGMAADTTANLATKRTKLYASQAAAQIEMLKTARNRIIHDFVVTQQGVADSLFRVENVAPEVEAAYKGKSRYTIEVAIGGESTLLEEESEESSESSTTEQ